MTQIARRAARMGARFPLRSAPVGWSASTRKTAWIQQQSQESPKPAAGAWRRASLIPAHSSRDTGRDEHRGTTKVASIGCRGRDRPVGHRPPWGGGRHTWATGP